VLELALTEMPVPLPDALTDVNAKSEKAESTTDNKKSESPLRH
jgi:hypothetical protein